MSKKIYVGNLSYNTTEDGLFSVFSQFGKVDSAMVIRDRFTDQSRGFGFVEMELEEAAREAIAALNGQMIDGRRVRVNAAEERSQGFRQGAAGGFQHEGGFRNDERRGRFGGGTRDGGFRNSGGRRGGARRDSDRSWGSYRGDSQDYSY